MITLITLGRPDEQPGAKISVKSGKNVKRIVAVWITAAIPPTKS